jgi:hypothetical protein
VTSAATRPFFTDAARRARLAHRHLLVPERRSDDVLQVTRSLVALHSSDPTTVYLSAAQRMRSGSIAAIDDALYEQRTVIRHHAMRRTLWVMPLETAMAAHSSTTIALVRPERARLANALVQSGITDDPHDWIDAACTALLRQLVKRGEATTRELGEALPEYNVPIVIAPNTAHAGVMSAHTRLLLLLGFVGAIVRTRPIGTWVSGQYRWASSNTWTGRAWSDDALPGKGDAQASIVDAYLRAFGPATAADAQWWTGWTKAVVTKALSAAGAVAVDTECGPAFVAAGDGALDDSERSPWVALLPALDPTTMGWKRRDWYVPEDVAAVAFDRNGNAGPTVWVDGQVVGGWAQRPDGSIATWLMEGISSTHEQLLADEIDRVRSLVGDVRFNIRFPSPLSRQLVQ